MADNTLDILIKIAADTHGAQAVQDSIKRVTGDSQKANTEFQKGAEKSTVQVAEWKRSLQVLGSEFGVIGRIAAFVFNPIIGITAAASIGIRALKQSTVEYNTALETARQGVGNLAGEIEKMETERIRQDEAFKTSLKQLDEGLQLRIRRVHEEKSALEALAQAREQFELSQAQTDEQKAGIRARYSGMRAGFGTDALAREIKLREESLAALQGLMTQRGTEAQRLSGGIAPDKLAALVKDLPKQIADAETLQKQFGADAELSWSDRLLASVGVILDRDTAGAIAGKGLSAAQGSVKARQFAEAAKRKLPQFESALAADRAARELQTRIG